MDAAARVGAWSVEAPGEPLCLLGACGVGAAPGPALQEPLHLPQSCGKQTTKTQAGPAAMGAEGPGAGGVHSRRSGRQEDCARPCAQSIPGKSTGREAAAAEVLCTPCPALQGSREPPPGKVETCVSLSLVNLGDNFGTFESRCKLVPGRAPVSRTQPTAIAKSGFAERCRFEPKTVDVIFQTFATNPSSGGCRWPPSKLTGPGWDFLGKAFGGPSLAWGVK